MHLPRIPYNVPVFFPQTSALDDNPQLKKCISIGRVLDDIRTYAHLFTPRVYVKPDEYLGESKECYIYYFYNLNALLLSLRTNIFPMIASFLKRFTHIRFLFFTVLEGTILRTDVPHCLTDVEALSKAVSIEFFSVSDYTHTYVEKFLSLLPVRIPHTKFYHTLDTSVFQPPPSPTSIAHQGPTREGPFQFLFIGTAGKRKNLQLLLQAFCSEFTTEENVHLTIKTSADKQDLVRSWIPADRSHQIHLLFSNIEYSQIVSLYYNSDVFVLPTRCEGFGLPILEAMMCGTPVLAPYHTGMTTYAKPDEIMVLPYVEEPIQPADASEISYGGGVWYTIRQTDLQQGLRRAYTEQWRRTPTVYTRVISTATKLISAFGHLYKLPVLFEPVPSFIQMLLKKYTSLNDHWITDKYYHTLPKQIRNRGNAWIRCFQRVIHEQLFRKHSLVYCLMGKEDYSLPHQQDYDHEWDYSYQAICLLRQFSKAYDTPLHLYVHSALRTQLLSKPAWVSILADTKSLETIPWETACVLYVDTPPIPYSSSLEITSEFVNIHATQIAEVIPWNKIGPDTITMIHGHPSDGSQGMGFRIHEQSHIRQSFMSDLPTYVWVGKIVK